MDYIHYIFIDTENIFPLFLAACILVIVSAKLFHTYVAPKKITMSQAPFLCDIVTKDMHNVPHSQLVFTACKKCGEHAVKKGSKILCLSIRCRHKTLHA